MNTKLTSEQKLAIKLQQELHKLMQYCKESAKVMSNPDNRIKFRRIVEIQKIQKSLKNEYDGLRADILETMKSCQSERIIDISVGKQMTISKRGTHSNREFDEERFKRENPELYKKYCYSYSTYSHGDTLTLTNISEKTLKLYKSEELNSYVTLWYPNEPKPEYIGNGTLFTIKEFAELLNSGCITEYDGIGKYYDGSTTDSCWETVVLNDIIEDTFPIQYKFIVWYNR